VRQYAFLQAALIFKASSGRFRALRFSSHHFARMSTLPLDQQNLSAAKFRFARRGSGNAHLTSCVGVLCFGAVQQC